MFSCSCTQTVCSIYIDRVILVLWLFAVSRYSVSANLSLESEEDISSELQLFKQAGGGTVCDVTCIGIRIE